MMKSDLENKMVVETRNGDRLLVVEDFLVGNKSYMRLSNFDNELVNENDESGDCDINKVYELKWAHHLMSENFHEIDEEFLIWEREEECVGCEDCNCEENEVEIGISGVELLMMMNSGELEDGVEFVRYRKTEGGYEEDFSFKAGDGLFQPNATSFMKDRFVIIEEDEEEVEDDTEYVSLLQAMAMKKPFRLEGEVEFIGTMQEAVDLMIEIYGIDIEKHMELIASDVWEVQE